MSSPELIAPERLEALLSGAFADTDAEASLQGLALKLRSAAPEATEALRGRVRALSAVRSHRRRSFSPRRLAVLLAPLALAVILVSLVAGGDISVPWRTTGQVDTLAGREVGEAQQVLRAQRQTPSVLSPVLGYSPLLTRNLRAQHVDMWIELRVRDADRLSSAANDAMRITRELGGFVASSTVGTRADEGRAELALRVPVGKVDDALFRLSQLGAITSQRVGTEDRQEAIDSSSRRIAALQSAVRIAQLRLGSGTLTPKERLQIQIKLERLRGQLASLRRSNAQLVREAATAELTLVLHTRAPASGQVDKSGVGGIVGDAFHFLGRAGAVALFTAIVLSPLVLLALLVWLLRRRYLLRQEADLLDRTTPGEPSPQPPSP
jgi:hypothetical protein